MSTTQGTTDTLRSNVPLSALPTNPFPTEHTDPMEKMEAAGTPGPGHEALEAMIGEWIAEVRCWSHPGCPTEITPGTATATWKLGGRFVEEDFQGIMMGRPFIGRTLLGYDNTKGAYNSVWVSDTQTSMFVSEGRADASGKVITLKGTGLCPIRGRREIRSVLRLISADEHTFEMFDVTDGGEGKMMEIRYTRR